MGKVKKVIAIVVTASLISGGIGAGLLYMRGQNVKTVTVCKAGSLASNYYFSDENTLEGSITSNVQQNVSISKDMIIDKIYVSQGESVKVGQELVSFDTTLIEMKLGIERLKREKLAIDLGMAMARLERLRNGGAITESDLEGMGTQDSLSGLPNSSDDAEDDDEDYEVLAMLPQDTRGSFLAAAFRPVSMLAVAIDLFGSEDAGFGSDAGTAGSFVSQSEPDFDSDSDDDIDLSGDEDDDLDDLDDLDDDDDDSENLDDLDGDDDDYFSGINLYAQEGELSDGFSSGGSGSSGEGFTSGGSTGIVPFATPTPLPGEESSPVYLDDFSDASAFTLSDGEEPFYQEIDWNTIPLCGNGSKEDPFVYLCSSARGKVYVTGGFLNIMAGYTPDGTMVRHPGGYWYQLEFHSNDTIQDLSNRKTSCTGYYLINGSLLINPVDQFLTTDFSLSDASQYSAVTDLVEDDDDLDDMDDLLDLLDDGDSSSSSTSVNRGELIHALETQVNSYQLDLREADIGITKLERQCAKKVIYSKLDGNVAKLQSGATSGNLMTIKSAEGFYVRGSVSELMLDQVTPGTKLNCSNWSSGSSFEAEVMDVSEYPLSGGYSDGNPNVSYYSYTATILDKEAKVSDSDWLSVTLQKSADDTKGIVLEKAFVRSENGNYYVYKDDNGVLVKQYVQVKANVDGGYSVLIGAGLSREDLIAFPYGEGVVEGAKTVVGTSEAILGY